MGIEVAKLVSILCTSSGCSFHSYPQVTSFAFAIAFD